MIRAANCPAAVISVAIIVIATTSEATTQSLCDKSDIRVVNSMREIAQPYHSNLDKGGRWFTAWAGLKQYVLQLNQGDSDKQISLMRLLLATNAKCTIFNVEPNADFVVKPMVDAANRSGAWIVTHWAHNEGLHPFDGNDHWMAHVAVDSLEAGVTVSRLLVDAIARTGGLVALQGRLDTDPARKRFAGLQTVLQQTPGVNLLDQQTANWDRTTAFPIMQTWLAKYGTRINGVWAANDDMALGALEALRAVGLAGKIPIVGVDGIPEAIAAVEKGEMVATISSDAYYQGSIGLAMGTCVLTGQVPLPALWPKEKREFYLKLVVISRGNAAQYSREPQPSAYVDDWQCDKLWSRSTGKAF